MVSHKITRRVPTVGTHETIGHIHAILGEHKFDTINYIYVLDANEALVGVLSVRDVFLRSPHVVVGDVMEREVVHAKTNDDAEKVAALALRHNLKAVPVVNESGVFAGVLPSDAILHMLHNRHVELFLLSTGIHSSARETFEGTPWFVARARTPWLAGGLVGGFFAASVVSFFEASLTSHFILASFIPLMVYMADAVGTQTQTIFIRGLVFEGKIRFAGYLAKELLTGFIISIPLALLLGLVAYFGMGTAAYIAFILGVSLVLTIVTSVFVGVSIPFTLFRLGKDPAIGAGPFGTIVRDLASLVIYLCVATAVLQAVGI